MITVTINQFPTSDGVLIEVSLDQASAIVAYAKETSSGTVWDLKEDLTVATYHTVPLKIPKTSTSTVIVVHPIQ